MSPTERQKQPASDHWRVQARRIIGIQTLSAPLMAVAALLWGGWPASGSVAFGALLVVANSVLLARSVAGSVRGDLSKGRVALYRSAAVRFVGLILALASGYVVGLYLPAVAAGMFGAYLAGFVYTAAQAFRARHES